MPYYRPEQEPNEGLKEVSVADDIFRHNIGFMVFTNYQTRALTFLTMVIFFVITSLNLTDSIEPAMFLSFALSVLPALMLGTTYRGLPNYFYMKSKLFWRMQVFWNQYVNKSGQGVTVTWDGIKGFGKITEDEED